MYKMSSMTVLTAMLELNLFKLKELDRLKDLSVAALLSLKSLNPSKVAKSLQLLNGVMETISQRLIDQYINERGSENMIKHML